MIELSPPPDLPHPAPNPAECPVAMQAANRPEAPALIERGAVLSYLDLDERVNARVARLRECGAEEGSRWALLGPVTPETIVVLLALWRLGATAVPLNPRQPAAVLQAMLDNTQAVALIGEPPAAVAIPAHPWASFSAAPTARRRGSTAWPEQRPAVIIHTSGSSGQPKSAVLTLGQLAANARGANCNIPLLPGDAWLLSLPLFHVGGLGILFRAFLSGAAVALPPAGRPWHTVLEETPVTHLSLVSTQLVDLLECVESSDFRRLQAVLLGGGAFAPDLLRRAADAGLPLHFSYGLTEMGSQVTTTRPLPPGAESAGSGRLLPLRRLRLAADGEIQTAGPCRFSGYLVQGKLETSFLDGEWFATGDLGTVHGTTLHVLGRRDNMFVSGGENIHPEEIENALLAVPGVLRAAVAPVLDSRYGMRPVAFLRLASPGEGVRETLLEALERRLPRFKIPDRFYAWPEEEDTVGLKISRPLVRSWAESAARRRLLFEK